MDKFDAIKCKFGLHTSEIYKEEEMTDIRGNVIGKIIINRCTRCGKITVIKVRTVENY